MRVGRFFVLLLFLILLIAVATDIKTMKISNRLIASGLILGLAFQILGNGYAGILYFILNITIPVILCILLFQMHALGAGDIKLFSVVGSFLTTEQLIKVMVFSFFAAAMLGIAKIGFQYWICGRKKQPFTKIHFSIAVLLAVLYVVRGM